MRSRLLVDEMAKSCSRRLCPEALGCKPAPSIKLATNSPMYRRMEDDMDVNCGTILDGDETVQACGRRI